LLEGVRAGDLERHVARVHTVIRAKEAFGLEVDDREPGQDAAPRCFLNALVDGRDELAGDHTARYRIREQVALAARAGLEAHVAVSELAVAAGLLLVLALRRGLAADRLAIGDARLLGDDLDAVLPPQPLHLHLEVQFAGTADD